MKQEFYPVNIKVAWEYIFRNTLLLSAMLLEGPLLAFIASRVVNRNSRLRWYDYARTNCHRKNKKRVDL